MWSNAERPSNRCLTRAVLLLGCVVATAACASPTSVCPARRHAIVQQIDIFDGPPKDLAFIAPDDPDKAPDTYTLGDIYARGGKVVVRCHYGDGATRDVELKPGTRSCRYVEPHAGTSAALFCQ